ncbi:MAG TPA: hypothetical protein VM686_15735 [Polyangiaceae bacterium]|jgi:hypothetical protein|nr:hypothetical protein [Polyangiaceae bacterium]
MVLSFCAGCGDVDVDHPDVLPTPPGAAVSNGEPEPGEDDADDVAVGLCKHEAKRECKITVSVRNGVRTCVAGEQRCESGHWSDCKQHEKEEDGAAGAAN